MKPTPPLTSIQDDYIATINAGIDRWAHRPKAYGIAGGHSNRILRGARHKAEERLRRIGFTEQPQIDQILKDARDMAALLRNSREPDDAAA